MYKQLNGSKPQDCHKKKCHQYLELEDLPHAHVALRYDVVDIRPLYISQNHSLNGSHVLLSNMQIPHKFSEIRIPSCPFIIFMHSYYDANEEYVLVRTIGKSENNDVTIQLDFYNTGFTDIVGSMPYATVVFSALRSSPYCTHSLSYTLHLDSSVDNRANRYVQDSDTYNMFVNQKNIVCSAIFAVMESTIPNTGHIHGKIGDFPKCSRLTHTPIFVKTIQTNHGNIIVELRYDEYIKKISFDANNELNRAARRSKNDNPCSRVKPGNNKKYFWE